MDVCDWQEDYDEANVNTIGRIATASFKKATKAMSVTSENANRTPGEIASRFPSETGGNMGLLMARRVLVQAQHGKMALHLFDH